MLLSRGCGTERRWVFLVTAVEICSQGTRLLVLEGWAAARHLRVAPPLFCALSFVTQVLKLRNGPHDLQTI